MLGFSLGSISYRQAISRRRERETWQDLAAKVFGMKNTGLELIRGLAALMVLLCHLLLLDGSREALGFLALAFNWGSTAVITFSCSRAPLSVSAMIAIPKVANSSASIV